MQCLSLLLLLLARPRKLPGVVRPPRAAAIAPFNVFNKLRRLMMMMMMMMTINVYLTHAGH